MVDGSDPSPSYYFLEGLWNQRVSGGDYPLIPSRGREPNFSERKWSMPKDSTTKTFLTGIASSAAWEWIKAAVGGGFVSAMLDAINSYLHHRPADWWGVLILGVVTSVVLFLILKRGGTRAAVSIGSQSPPAAVEPAPDPYAGVISPLQLDALRLARDLLAFLKEIAPQPADMTVVDWRRTIRAKYDRRFHINASDVYLRFAEIGFAEQHFASLVDITESPENVEQLAKVLREKAFLLFDVAVS